MDLKDPKSDRLVALLFIVNSTKFSCLKLKKPVG